jgi:cholesterol oxidase
MSQWDVVVVGSGFGGSVSALRLAERGLRVLVVEKGQRHTAETLPERSTQLKRWLWAPAVGFRGPFKVTVLRHVTILSGVGVGGGSLVYANTLPVPTDAFFQHGSWAGLREWRTELAPHYATAQRMLGAAEVPFVTTPDRVLREVAAELGRPEAWRPTRVGVWFGEPGVKVADPYFGGEGPPRVGCIRCGGCMLGCRHGAKNSLDQNYLWLAERRGVTVRPDTEVLSVRPRPEGGYRLELRPTGSWFGRSELIDADRVVFSGGVLGTVDLLLRMKQDGLPGLSPRVGDGVRTNSESLIAVVSDRDEDLSHGVAIGSIVHTDERSHLEPVRYGAGQANAWKAVLGPHAPGATLPARLRSAARLVGQDPRLVLRVMRQPDLAKSAMILLYMRASDGTLSLRRGPLGLTTTLQAGATPPQAFMDEATDLARRVEKRIGGISVSLVPELLLGTPSTAHILGGACIGRTADDGVIDADHRVFGYDGLFVADGSAVSANPGVNPSLTITAMAERMVASMP